MIQFLVLFVIVIINVIRFFTLKQKGKNCNYILISSYVQTIPFSISKSIYDLNSGSIDHLMIGEFGNSFKIETSGFFILLLWFINYRKFSKEYLYFKYNKVLYFFLALIALSYFNVSNSYSSSTFILLFGVMQLFILLIMFRSNFSKPELLLGVYDGLKITIIFQFLLTLCYPILGLQQVVTLFRGEDALLWTNRRDGYASATGTFIHPAGLALYSLFIIVFFLSCYLNKVKKRTSLFLIALASFCLFFTYSRTTYICSMAVVAIIFVVAKTKGNIFSLKKISLILFFFFLFAFIFYLSPFSDLFLKSDSEEQFDNRFSHWIIGIEMWWQSKLLGLGMNSHVYYMSNFFNGGKNLQDLPIFSFLLSNPIHNIHVIVLVETGLIGISFWFYYFFSRIGDLAKKCSSKFIVSNIFSLTFLGCLISFFIYGFFGWTPFSKELYTLLIFVGMLTDFNTLKSRKSVKMV